MVSSLMANLQKHLNCWKEYMIPYHGGKPCLQMGREVIAVMVEKAGMEVGQHVLPMFGSLEKCIHIGSQCSLMIH